MSWTINEQSKTSETQYFNASYTTSLSTVTDALLSSITQEPAGAPIGVYNAVASTSSGAGTGASFNVVVESVGTVAELTVVAVGSGYAVGDTVTIANGLIGGGGTDLVITLDVNDFGTNGSGGIIVPDNVTTDSASINVSGYTAGTISFSISPAPDAGGGTAWAVNSTLEISIIGGIDINNFVAYTLIKNKGDANSTFYVNWNIPLETVSLRINNNTAISTVQQITISSIRMITESNGGGLGYVSTSGASSGPGGITPEIQFNDVGSFGGASGSLYDKTANTNTGQVKLANGSVGEPILAFADGAGNYDTGIYRVAANTMGFSANSSLIAGVSGDNLSVIGGTAAIPGINFGVTGTDIDTGMYRVALTAPLGASAIGFSTGTQQKVTIVPGGVGVTPPTGMIEGLNVGLTSDIAGIRRLSVNDENSWEDGNCGNSEFIVFTATDFMQTLQTGGGPGNGTIYPLGSGNVVNGPVVYNIPDEPGDIFASKLIPKGFILLNRNPCFIYSDVRTTLSVPQLMTVEIYAQQNAGITVASGFSLANIPINAGSSGWQTSGDGSVNRTAIDINFASGAAADAATGTGRHVVTVLVHPDLVMNGTNGGVVAVKVPITRI